MSILLGGCLLGLAGALHCACMCGGLASATFSLFAVRSRWHGIATFGGLLVGRIAAYATLGALVAAFASLAAQILPLAPSPGLIPWIGASVLVWIGLSTAGLFPALSFSGLGRVTAPAPLDRALSSIRRVPILAPFATGVVWGLTPCPLIYAALFTAALTGSAAGGFLWMLGFGLGTVPAVLFSAAGIGFLTTASYGPITKIIVGLAIVAFGLATFTLDHGIFSVLCT
ncbi:MAG: sulfite exporter TauE/SafE family protein [Alphaproteobacteria bacterium]|nr:sulfite exporter TauE/SafE family protein [Alphaproteobacteria bacterium]